MKKKLVSALALMMSCVMLAACGGNKVGREYNHSADRDQRSSHRINRGSSKYRN